MAEPRTISAFKETLRELPTIKGNTIYLAPLPQTEEFYRTYLRWLKDKKILQDIGCENEVYTLERIASMQTAKIAAKNNLSFCIYETSTNKPIGDIDLSDSPEFNSLPEITIMIAESQGKGRGAEALRLLIDCAFNSIRVSEINLSVYTNNERAIRLYKKLGFKTTGKKTDPDNNREEYLMRLAHEDYEKT